MTIYLDYNSSLPMYEQIKEAIKQNIYNGELTHHDPLPSIRQLAKDLNVSMMTTKRAYTDLEHEGFIYTLSGKGTFVKLPDLTEVLYAHQQKLLLNYTDATQKMYEIGILKKDLLKIIETIYKE